VGARVGARVGDWVHKPHVLAQYRPIDGSEAFFEQRLTTVSFDWIVVLHSNVAFPIITARVAVLLAASSAFIPSTSSAHVWRIDLDAAACVAEA